MKVSKQGKIKAKIAIPSPWKHSGIILQKELNMAIHVEVWETLEVTPLEMFQYLLGIHNNGSNSPRHPRLELVDKTLPCKVGWERAQSDAVGLRVTFFCHFPKVGTAARC